jgi:Family of unknown function (DUF6328)
MRLILADRLGIAIDELRVQMLSTEVLFGFQLQSTFKEGFAHLSAVARFVDVISLTCLVLTLATLIAAPAQHRVVEEGNASIRILRVTGRLAALALVFMAVALSGDAFIVTEYFLGRTVAILAGAGTGTAAIGLWFWLTSLLRPRYLPAEELPCFECPPLHDKIEQMLKEAWVALPGATGIFGFQLSVTLLPDFSLLPASVQHVHFAALGFVALAIIILMTPGPVHRIAFRGREDPRSHRHGSRLLSLGLAPLALGISADYYVAVGKMQSFDRTEALAAAGIFLVLMAAWFVVPRVLRARIGPLPHGAVGTQ